MIGTYRTAAAFRTALEAHLTTYARAAGISIQRTRKVVLFERLLIRLQVVAPDRWLLKGALALDFRFGARARATSDMDLARRDDIETATADLMAAADLDLGDYFAFVAQRTDRLDTLEEATAVRYHVRADLAGRVFEQAVLDVGFVSPAHWQTETIAVPNLLAFAQVPPLVVPALPLPQQVAEKFHAYTRAYGAGGRLSSREKDLLDLVLIAGFCPFDGHVIRRALDETFAARARQELPPTVPPPPTGWGPGYRKLALAMGMDPDVQHAQTIVAGFLDPVLATGSFSGRWDPVAKSWSSEAEAG